MRVGRRLGDGGGTRMPLFLSKLITFLLGTEILNMKNHKKSDLKGQLVFIARITTLRTSEITRVGRGVNLVPNPSQMS